MTTAITRSRWSRWRRRGRLPVAAWCWPSSRIAMRTRDCFGGFRQGVRPRSTPLPGRNLRRRRGCISSPPTAARWPAPARRWQGRTGVRQRDIAAMPQTIPGCRQAGDVVLTMGAGSIGTVPGKVAGGQMSADSAKWHVWCSAAPPPNARFPSTAGRACWRRCGQGIDAHAFDPASQTLEALKDMTRLHRCTVATARTAPSRAPEDGTSLHRIRRAGFGAGHGQVPAPS